MTSIFLLMDHFLYRFSALSEKMEKKSIDWKFVFFAKPWHYRIFGPFISLSVRRFQMPLEGLSFLKTLVTFGIYATDPLLQDMTKIVCFR